VRHAGPGASAPRCASARCCSPRALLAALALLAVLVTVPAASAKSDLSTDWRAGFTSDIDFNANPFAAQLTPAYFMFTEVYDTLTSYDRNGNPDLAHSLATSFDVSKDGKLYTFHLRHGVRWSDGVPFSADDVVYSWNVAGPLSTVNASYLDNVDKAIKVDNDTVQIKMKSGDARIPSAYVFIVPEHVWTKVKKDKFTAVSPCCPVVGTGPFTVTKMDKKGTTILLPNPYFYGPRGHIKRILLIKYGESDAMLRDIKLNQLDAVLEGDLKWVRPLRRDPSLQVWVAPTPQFDELAFNDCRPGGNGQTYCDGPGKDVHVKVVQDQAVRDALKWGIDRANILRTAYSSVGFVSGGIIGPYYRGKGYYKDWSKDPAVGYAYDPAKARKILADGGWQCPSNGTCTKGGVKAEFTLALRTASTEAQSAGRRIAAWARDIGIKVDLAFMTDETLDNLIYATSAKNKDHYQPNYDAFIWDWYGDVGTPDSLFSYQACDYASSDALFCNKEFDRLAKQALGETDFKKRVDLLHQAERIGLEKGPYIYLVHPNAVFVTRKDTWKNYYPDVGQPYEVSWYQLQAITPGKRASLSYTGAPLSLGLLGVGAIAVLGASLWRRRREEHGPLEVDAATAGGGA